MAGNKNPLDDAKQAAINSGVFKITPDDRRGVERVIRETNKTNKGNSDKGGKR